MITKEKGYSLNVLVITIAVMLILMSTAIVTMQNLTKDRAITEFMSDLQEVEEYVKEYYSRKNSLPIQYQNNEPLEVTITNQMQVQADPNDKGAYYLVDFSKLGNLNLFDEDRGGYLLNESTLNIYVLEPIEYNDVEYFTLTDEILGVDKTYGNADTFEVIVTGNPVTWTSNFNLMVSIPDRENINSSWSFKYYKKGPITAEQFKSMGTFFEYGQPIEIDENGIHSIYVEDEGGYAKVVNVVVTKIDDVDPYIYLTNEGKIVVGDDETGIKRVMYKIADYDISENDRATDIETYFQGTLSHLPDAAQAGRWTFEEAYTGERIDGATPSVGRSINTYKADYEAYLAQYEILSGDPSGDVRDLDTIYPQFQHNGIPYRDDEENIVLYVEDYSDNRKVTDKNNYMYKVSREMLLDSNFIDTIIIPLKGAKILIDNGAEYTNNIDGEVDLTIRAQGAEYMYITTDEDEEPPISIDDWDEFESLVSDFGLAGSNGTKTVYVYVTANQIENGTLKYEKVSDTIYLDNTKPTDTKPEVPIIGNELRLKVNNKQVDNESGIAKLEYGYKLAEDTKYTWLENLTGVILEANKKYNVRTRVTDKAGNVQESKVVEVKTPAIVARTLPNEPAMATGMKAIVWDGSLDRPGKELEIDPVTGKTLEGAEATWYNYNIGDNINDTRDSIWANAKTEDGSYWVWIPRFAYKIIYYEEESKDTVKGYFQNSPAGGAQYYKPDGTTASTDPDDVKSQYATIDIVFLNGTSDTQYREENITTNAITIKNLSSEYIVHPAFQRASATAINNSLGKWSSDVTGIWVAKFEASREDATIDDIGVGTKIKSVPSVKSAVGVSASAAYDYCEDMYSTMYSHMMKNSEWGAVAYLAYSAYGRNGNEISSNRSADYITGGGGTTSSYTTSESTLIVNMRTM